MAGDATKQGIASGRIDPNSLATAALAGAAGGAFGNQVGLSNAVNHLHMGSTAATAIAAGNVAGSGVGIGVGLGVSAVNDGFSEESSLINL